MFRKRHIGFLIAAQTLSQFELVYGRTAAEAMLAGLATQIYFGSCDAITARFVSDAVGMATELVPASHASRGALSTRQRRLIYPEEIVTPPRGNCTIIHHTASASYAAQIVILASLTRMYERMDWRERVGVAHKNGKQALLMQRPLFNLSSEHLQPSVKLIFNNTASKTDNGDLCLPSLGDY